MKKVYVKPELMFENFFLSANIAGDCGIKTYTPNSGQCAYPVDAGDFGTWNIFIDTVDACTTKEQDGEYNGICYDVPFSEANLFNS